MCTGNVCVEVLGIASLIWAVVVHEHAVLAAVMEPPPLSPFLSSSLAIIIPSSAIYNVTASVIVITLQRTVLNALRVFSVCVCLYVCLSVYLSVFCLSISLSSVFIFFTVHHTPLSLPAIVLICICVSLIPIALQHLWTELEATGGVICE